jgi:uncharacterized protein
MLYYFICCIILMTFACAFSQIQTTDLPQPGFKDRIRKAVNDIWIIDTHEHLETEEQRLGKKDLDFTYLYSHYANEDLISASHSQGLVSVILGRNFSLSDRWELFKAFYDDMRNTGYARAAIIAAKDLYGISDLNDNTYLELSEKMRQANKPGLYRSILKDKARIDLSILDVGEVPFDPDFFRHVVRFDNFINVYTIAEIKRLCLNFEISEPTLENFCVALKKTFEKAMVPAVIGVKSGLAYNRILKYDNITKEEAEHVFVKLKNWDSKKGRPEFKDVKPLQDYMMHRVLDLADEYNMPVQIHTGLHAGNGNYINNSNPTHLTNLFFEYPEVNFCLFHSAYPFGGQLSVLAKNFPNVFIDMCWSQVISPSYTVRYLHEWLETVPANKIMAFGGDYITVDLVYAHSVMARRVVTNVLIDKVKCGFYTESEALNIAQKLLRDNALEIFKLKGRSRSLANLPALKKPGFLKDWWEVHNSTKGLITKWWIVGPFEYGDGLETVCPPEKKIELGKAYDGADGKVAWEKVSIKESGYLNLVKLFYNHPEDHPEDLGALGYAFTQVKSPDNRSAKITIGSNDGAKLWVNGKVVYNEHVARGAVADQVFVDVQLKKGTNDILAKVENLGNNWGLYLRIVDPNSELVFN